MYITFSTRAIPAKVWPLCLWCIIENFRWIGFVLVGNHFRSERLKKHFVNKFGFAEIVSYIRQRKDADYASFDKNPRREESDEVAGVLFLLNTVGGDVESGLAIAEMIASLSKPTRSEIDEFRMYLSGDRGYSPRTISTYVSDLSAFSEYLQSVDVNLRWDDVDGDLVRRWVMERMKHHTAPQTVKRQLSTLRSFFKYRHRMGRGDGNPVRYVGNPKVENRLPTYVKESEMERLFEVEAFGDDFIGRRNRLLVLLLYTTGVRVSELMGLTLSSLDLEKGELKVTGKRNKQRIVPFGEELQKELKGYLEQRSQSVPVVGNHLFVRIDGRQVQYHEVRLVVRNALSMVTTLKKKSPHVLRHTFATAMLNNGAELEAVKELLGHESLAATEVYTHATFAELKKEYEQAHPRA